MEIWRKLLNRMMRAARMDASLYEEMETEEDAAGHAVMIALLASVATGVGAGVAAVIGGKGIVWLLWGLLSGFFASLVGWFAWVLLTYLSASTILKGHERASWMELTRTLGFANSPGVLRLLLFIPMIGWLIIIITGIWTLAAGITAVKQTLEYSPGKAAVTCLLGWLAYMAVLVLVYIWLPSPYKMPAF